MLLRRRFAVLAFVPALLSGLAVAQQGGGKIEYPPAPTVGHTDEYHGAKVADPYRWLEEYSDQTNKWIEAEAKLTQA